MDFSSLNSSGCFLSHIKTQHRHPLVPRQDSLAHIAWGRTFCSIPICHLMVHLMPLKPHPGRGNAWVFLIRFSCFTWGFTALSHILLHSVFARRRVPAFSTPTDPCLSQSPAHNHHSSLSQCPMDSNSSTTRLGCWRLK